MDGICRYGLRPDKNPSTSLSRPTPSCCVKSLLALFLAVAVSSCVEERLGSGCASDEDCFPGERCTAGVCTTIDDPVVDSTTDLAADLSEDEAEVLDSSDHDPEEDDGSAEETDGATDTGEEGHLLQRGEACTAPEQCQSGNCTNDICCALDQVCCASDEQCAGGKLLACNSSAFECYVDCTEGGSAENDFMCVEEAHCTRHGCEPDIAVGACEEDSDCYSGTCLNRNCCEYAGLCCSSDEDCPEMFDGCSIDDTQTCAFSVFHYPDTGQTYCYNIAGELLGCDLVLPGHDLYGQDGHYPTRGRDFTQNEDGSITDLVTGLTWARLSSGPLNFVNAVNYCGDLSDHDGEWRLPKRYELSTLVDYGVTSGFMIRGHFDTQQTDLKYWTASPVAGEDSKLWVVDFQFGRVTQDGMLMTNRVRCVQVRR